MIYNVDFRDEATFGRGWHEAEPDGRWSSSRFAELALPIPETEPVWARMVLVLPRPMPRPQILRIWSGRECLAVRRIEDEDQLNFDVEFPAANLRDGRALLRLYISHVVPAATSKEELGDERAMSFKIGRCTISDSPIADNMVADLPPMQPARRPRTFGSAVRWSLRRTMRAVRWAARRLHI